MLTIRHFRALAFSLAVAGLALAGPPSEVDFRSKVVAIYDFEPHKLNETEMQAKADQLDQFWSLVKADPKNHLPLLRKELTDPTNSAFFFYDGSKLLLSLSKDRDDQALALRSIPKANILGIQPTDYLQTVHWFARSGFDTREAAFRILAFPDFKAFVPQHALTLGQDYSLIYMLFPMDESVFVGDLASRLSVESDIGSLKSVVLALWYTATPTGKAAIKNFIESSRAPEDAKTYAKGLLNRKLPPLSSISFPSVDALRHERRKVMHRPISDEALIEFDKLTAKLLSTQ